MKIAFYCRIGGKGYGFLLPEDTEKLREFLAEHKKAAALEKIQAQAKNFCRVLDIRVPKLVEAENRVLLVVAESRICDNADRLWFFRI